MNPKRRFSSIISDLKQLSWKIENPDHAQDAKYLLLRLRHAVDLTEEDFEEIRMTSLRGPAFDGDMVGWLDDDFTYEEPPYEPPTVEQIERLVTGVTGLREVVDSDAELQRKYGAIVTKLENYMHYTLKALEGMDLPSEKDKKADTDDTDD